MNESHKRQFENEMQKEYDRLDEIRADYMAWSIVLFIIGCIVYGNWNQISEFITNMFKH